MRWGMPSDSLFLKAGALDDVTLGYGLIVNNYSNTMQYPSVRNIGGRFRIKPGAFAIEGFVADFKEITGPGLIGARVSYDQFGPFTVGASIASDVNPYLGLPDEDNDGFPDRVDDFPENDNAAVDSDGDGIPDFDDLDRDGDGWADNTDISQRLREINEQRDTPLDPDGVNLKPEPFNAKNANAPTMVEVGADIALPIIPLTTDYTKLDIYAQAAMMFHENNAAAAVDTNGWGIGAPGIRFELSFPVNISMDIGFEYRIFSKYFVGEFYNRTYDLERASFRSVQTQSGDSLVVRTKAQRLLPQITSQMQGYYGSLGFNLFNYIRLKAVYQDYQGDLDLRDRSLYAAAQLNTSVIPKISTAYAYYQKSHILEDNFFQAKDESTILGYRLGYSLGGGVQLVFGYRETYVDKNGDGEISGGDETIRTTSVETVFNF
jgi:hypothetical protein